MRLDDFAYYRPQRAHGEPSLPAMMTATITVRSPQRYVRARTWKLEAQLRTGRAANGRDVYTLWITVGCTTMTARAWAGRAGRRFVDDVHCRASDKRELQRLRVHFVATAVAILGGYVEPKAYVP